MHGMAATMGAVEGKKRSWNTNYATFAFYQTKPDLDIRDVDILDQPSRQDKDDTTVS